jgi:hypothetical protein
MVFSFEDRNFLSVCRIFYCKSKKIVENSAISTHEFVLIYNLKYFQWQIYLLSEISPPTFRTHGHTETTTMNHICVFY